MAKSIGSIKQHPARVSLIWYAATITIGAVLLMQPFSYTDERRPITGLDAAFTSTSAVCVTGLTVRSTGHDYSWLGQVIIMALIQLGGVGIMTVTTYITLQLGGRQGLRQRAIITETLGAGENADIRWVLGRVLRLTLIFEGVGALVLFLRFLFDYGPSTALWHALFHSVAAFCNAGFGLHDDNLVRYQGDWIVNLTIIGLIVMGGIGFPVMIDLGRHWEKPWRDRWDALLLHSKLMVAGTAFLLTFGTVMFLLLEADGVLQRDVVPAPLAGGDVSFDDLPDGGLQHHQRGRTDRRHAVPVHLADGRGHRPVLDGRRLQSLDLHDLGHARVEQFSGPAADQCRPADDPGSRREPGGRRLDGLLRRGDHHVDGAAGHRAHEPSVCRVGGRFYGQGI